MSIPEDDPMYIQGFGEGVRKIKHGIIDKLHLMGIDHSVSVRELEEILLQLAMDNQNAEETAEAVLEDLAVGNLLRGLVPLSISGRQRVLGLITDKYMKERSQWLMKKG